MWKRGNHRRQKHWTLVDFMDSIGETSNHLGQNFKGAHSMPWRYKQLVGSMRKDVCRRYSCVPFSNFSSSGSVFLQKWDESIGGSIHPVVGCLSFSHYSSFSVHTFPILSFFVDSHQKMHCRHCPFLSARTCWLPSGWRRASVPASRDQAQRQFAIGSFGFSQRNFPKQRETRAASSSHRMIFHLNIWRWWSPFRFRPFVCLGWLSQLASTFFIAGTPMRGLRRIKRAA